mgnify:CR=1 FL=1
MSEQRYGTANIDYELYQVLRRMKDERRHFIITRWIEDAILEKLERDEGMTEADIFEDE